MPERVRIIRHEAVPDCGSSAAKTWFAENELEGVAFEYEVWE
jgi:hypothetical protein